MRRTLPGGPGDVLVGASLKYADLTRLADEVIDLDRAGIDFFLFDICDGCFVEELVFGPLFIDCLRPHSNKPFVARLMLRNPLSIVEPVVKAGADMVVFHLESDDDPLETAGTIAAAGAVPGLALYPETGCTIPSPLWNELQLLFLPTIHRHSAAGSPKMDAITRRMGELAREAEAGKALVRLAVNGDLDETAVRAFSRVGADTFIAGSTGLFGRSVDYAMAIESLRVAALKARKNGAMEEMEHGF